MITFAHGADYCLSILTYQVKFIPGMKFTAFQRNRHLRFLHHWRQALCIFLPPMRQGRFVCTVPNKTDDTDWILSIPHLCRTSDILRSLPFSTESQFTRYVFFKRYRFYGAVLFGKSDPEHVLVGRSLRNGATPRINAQAKHLVHFTLQHLLVAAGMRDYFKLHARSPKKPQQQSDRIDQRLHGRKPFGDVFSAFVARTMRQA